MNPDNPTLTVYYDGSCSTCIRDRKSYEKLAGAGGKDILWFDITGKDDELRQLGIDPYKALTELHVKDDRQQIYAEMDAYILLMSKVSVLKPLAWLIGLPVVRPLLSKIYRWQVQRRLRRTCRI